jgi:2,3-bisphosphoglycerate-dependent phosphoglycerate mutase
VLPFYEAKIWPDIRAGRNVIVAAHGNSLRALVMTLDRLSQEEVLALNLATGAPIVYRLNADGSTAEKRELGS